MQRRSQATTRASTFLRGSSVPRYRRNGRPSAYAGASARSGVVVAPGEEVAIHAVSRDANAIGRSRGSAPPGRGRRPRDAKEPRRALDRPVPERHEADQVRAACLRVGPGGQVVDDRYEGDVARAGPIVSADTRTPAPHGSIRRGSVECSQTIPKGWWSVWRLNAAGAVEEWPETAAGQRAPASSRAGPPGPGRSRPCTCRCRSARRAAPGHRWRRFRRELQSTADGHQFDSAAFGRTRVEPRGGEGREVARHLTFRAPG